MSIDGLMPPNLVNMIAMYVISVVMRFLRSTAAASGAGRSDIQSRSPCSSRRATSNRSGGALLAEIRVPYDGASSIVCDGSRMPLSGNVDVSRRRDGQGIQIHDRVRRPRYCGLY